MTVIFLLAVGHARCLVDGFAYIKQVYRRTDVETLGQLKNVVKKSSKTKVPVRFPRWAWRNWKTFLEGTLKAVKGIRFRDYDGSYLAMAEQHNRDLLTRLRKGDLIEFDRRHSYSHWGVYAGDGTVIHVTSEGVDSNFVSGCLCGSIHSVVRRDRLSDVANGDYAYKNNETDNELSAFWPDTIVENATDKIGKHGYDLLKNNCEHFAKYCRYGKAISDQANSVTRKANSVTRKVVGFIMLAGSFLHFAFRIIPAFLII